MVSKLHDYGRQADCVVAELMHWCERIAIAGSIRRRKPDPHDIEIVAVPRLEHYSHQVDMFKTEVRTRNLLDEKLDELKAQGALADRLDRNGRPAWGPRFKRAMVVSSQTPIDIFSVLAPAQWGVIFAIRTGPAMFGKLVVTKRLDGGAMPLGMRVEDGVLHGLDGVIETPEEEDYFHAIGLPCWPPAVRTEEALRAWLRKERVNV